MGNTADLRSVRRDGKGKLTDQVVDGSRDARGSSSRGSSPTGNRVGFRVPIWEASSMDPSTDAASARPTAGLRRYVSSYQGYCEDGVAPRRHRGLPSPYLTLILTFGEPLMLASSDGAVRRFDALAGGLHTAPAVIVHDGCQAGIQLSLTPLGARALLRLPAGALFSVEAHAADILGATVAAVRDEMMSAPSWQQRFAIVERWLIAEIRQDATLQPEVGEAWRLLMTSNGAMPVAAIAREVGWGTRHLRNRLRSEVGLTPKVAGRVIRFDRARHRLQVSVTHGERPLLADVAAESGYADQAHLAREFREFAGCAPSTWMAEEFPNVQARAPATMPPSGT